MPSTLGKPPTHFQRLRADACVVAMGAFCPLLLQPLGIRLQICPAKGDSVTMPLADASKAHPESLTDDGDKLVFSRLTTPSAPGAPGATGCASPARPSATATTAT